MALTVAVIIRADGYGSSVGRRVEVEHLIGAREIASRLGLPRVQAVHYLRRADPTFPPPIYWGVPRQGGTGGVWYWPDVWRWARRTKRPGIGQLPPLPKPVAGRRRIDVDDLLGSQQIADRLGVRFVQRVHVMRLEDPDFPAAVFVSGEGRWAKRLWAWPDVWRWAKDSGRRFPVDLGRSPASVPTVVRSS